MAPIRPPGQRQQSASPIKPTAPFELKMAPIKPKTVLIRAPGKRQRFLSPIKPRAPNEPRAPIKPKTAPIRPRSKGVLTDYSFGHLTRIQSQIQGSSVCFTFPSDHAPRVQQSFFCIIGLTSMLLLQGCVDPLVSGDGQTVSYQPHIHANTIRSSREQHRCSLNL